MEAKAGLRGAAIRHMNMRSEFVLLSKWIGISAAGMVVGVLLAAQVVSWMLTRWLELPTVSAEVALLGLLLLCGLAHGSSMGFAQSFVLGPRLHVPRNPWMLVTAAGAGIAWALGGSIVFVMKEPWELSDMFIALVLGGLVLGSILGFAQWLELRRYTSAVAWIPTNALAWVAGTVVAFATATIIPDDPTPQDLILAAMAATIGSGAAIGIITGLTLRSLQPIAP